LKQAGDICSAANCGPTLSRVRQSQCYGTGSADNIGYGYIRTAEQKKGKKDKQDKQEAEAEAEKSIVL
jgi:hypothetical protein